MIMMIKIRNLLHLIKECRIVHLCSEVNSWGIHTGCFVTDYCIAGHCYTVIYHKIT